MSHNSNLHYEFGSYHLDSGERVLMRKGEIISLTPKAVEILIYLVHHAGQLVEKETLLREIWPDTFVEEANLTQNIFLLRKRLGDHRSAPQYIETVTRRGYRFIAAVCKVETLDQYQINKSNSQTFFTEKTPEPRPTVIAILPFINATGNTEIEYLADGITDNLINNLSRVTRLRVMSRSTVFRRKGQEGDPQEIGKILGADVLLLGSVNLRPHGFVIDVELMDVTTGWRLGGSRFNCENKEILEIQDTITMQLLETLKLRLTGEEERQITARYTENAEAYQAYLAGRYHWSRYTKKGIEKAIGYFRSAIECDPHYALAYVAIVDCYLRLATNYLPPEEDLPKPARKFSDQLDTVASPKGESNPKVKLRFEWDWKSAERELKRANEIKADYPSAHQWYAAYQRARQIYHESLIKKGNSNITKQRSKDYRPDGSLPTQITSLQLTLSEQVQVYAAIAREQIDAGNYEAASQILQRWWAFGDWPSFDGLNQLSCADLLFTAGELASWIASTKQLHRGQKHGEELLNGSIALFEQLGFRRRAAEGRIELALCYYRQGLFDIGRTTLIRVLNELSHESSELRSLALIRLASLERHAGRLRDALARLSEASQIVELSGPWATGRCLLELASTYKDLATAEGDVQYSDRARDIYFDALYQFEAVGNHLLSATVENNLGCLMLSINSLSDAELHLLRARRIFDCFQDLIRCAQVDDSLARLYLANENIEAARVTIERAVEVMETGDEDALLAEAVTTKGTIYCRIGRHSEAKRLFESAHHLAQRCGDSEGAGRALLVMMEEMCPILETEERNDVSARMVALLSGSQQSNIKRRVAECLRGMPPSRY